MAAALCRRDRCALTLLVKPGHLSSLERDGISVRGVLDGIYTPPLAKRVDVSLKDVLVIPMVKLVDLRELVEKLKPRMTPSTAFLLLTNGVGIRRDVYRWSGGIIGEDSIYRGIVEFGGTLEGPGRVRVYPGGVALENRFRQSPWGDCFQGWELETRWPRDIRPVVWKKLLVNSIFNPLSVLLNTSNRGISRGYLNPIKEKLLVEGRSVARARGIEVDLSLENLNSVVCSDNRNSMLQDILRGRKTEIDFINGRLVRMAAETGRTAPVHDFLVHLIHGVEETAMRNAPGNEKTGDD